MPLVDPVTTAVLPFSDMASDFFGLLVGRRLRRQFHRTQQKGWKLAGVVAGRFLLRLLLLRTCLLLLIVALAMILTRTLLLLSRLLFARRLLRSGGLFGD